MTESASGRAALNRPLQIIAGLLVLAGLFVAVQTWQRMDRAVAITERSGTCEELQHGKKRKVDCTKFSATVEYPAAGATRTLQLEAGASIRQAKSPDYQPGQSVPLLHDPVSGDTYPPGGGAWVKTVMLFVLAGFAWLGSWFVTRSTGEIRSARRLRFRSQD